MDKNLAATVETILNHHGVAVLQKPDSFLGLLFDYCPEANRHEAGLVGSSVREGIAALIVQTGGEAVPEAGVLEMKRILREQAQVGEEAAADVVDFWLRYAGKTVQKPAKNPQPEQTAALSKPRSRNWCLLLAAVFVGAFAAEFLGFPHYIAHAVGIGFWSYYSREQK